MASGPKIFQINRESAEGVEGLGLPLKAVPSKVESVKLGCHATAPWTSSRGFKAGSDWTRTAFQSALEVCPGRDILSCLVMNPAALWRSAIL
jgi:hypothetical protein